MFFVRNVNKSFFFKENPFFGGGSPHLEGVKGVYSRIKRDRNVVLTLRCEFLPFCYAGSSLCE